MLSLKLNVNTKVSLFDTYVGSVANYGCEVWGLHSAKNITTLKYTCVIL